jgi:hypothetical protein
MAHPVGDLQAMMKSIPKLHGLCREQQISTRLDENTEDYRPTLLPSWRLVGLLLDEDEAIDIVT